ncbi:MAG: DnaD domain protein [Chloroflexi bacterium]|nr:DnaD domain protein [Chloroflexota bacterium]
MKTFTGFPEGRLNYTPVPDLFFADLLSEIDDLAELKLTIYMFWALYHQKGSPRYLVMSELESEGPLLSGLPTLGDETRLDALHQAVTRAVTRGTILQLDINANDSVLTYLFLNTPQGRAAIREVKEGTLVLETEGRVVEPHIQHAKPSIFTLYEENIGLLTPLISEQLLEASKTYPDNWIREAFQIAVERNVRNWRYIEAILKRWSISGRKQE